MFEDLPIDVLCEILRRTGAPSVYCGILRHVSREFAARISPGNPTVSMCERIVETPYTGLIDWAIATGYEISRDICSSADAAGNLVMLKHLRGLGFDWGKCPEMSAWRGHLDVVKYAVESGCPVGMSMSRAADGGHLEICQWLSARGAEIDDYTGLCAVKSSQKDIIRWIIEVRPKCGWKLMNEAYRVGNVKITNLLHKMDYFLFDVFRYAAREHGHLDMLKWYRGIGGHIGPYEALCNAVIGQLHFLVWLKEIGVAIDYDKCIAAAEAGGHTECVEWLRATRS